MRGQRRGAFGILGRRKSEDLDRRSGGVGVISSKKDVAREGGDLRQPPQGVYVCELRKSVDLYGIGGREGAEGHWWRRSGELWRFLRGF